MTLLLPDTSEFQWPPQHRPGTNMAGIRSLNGGAAIIRHSYGLTHPDVAFRPTRAAAAGFAFLGIYQYIRAGQDAATQARFMAGAVGRLGPHEVLIADLEEGAGDQHARAMTWLEVAEDVSGKRPWLYSDVAFAEEHGLAPIFSGDAYHTWAAAYGSSEPALGHTLWQSTDGAQGSNRVNWPGAGFCDTSVYHGTLTELHALVAPVPPPAPPPTPPPAPPAEEEPEMILVQPAKNEVPAGTAWPGVFLLFSDGALHHVGGPVGDVSNVASYNAAGVKGPVNITWAEYTALGGKPAAVADEAPADTPEVQA